MKHDELFGDSSTSLDYSNKGLDKQKELVKNMKSVYVITGEGEDYNKGVNDSMSAYDSFKRLLGSRESMSLESGVIVEMDSSGTKTKYEIECKFKSSTVSDSVEL